MNERDIADILEELRAIRKILEEGNARQIEYFPDGTTKRVSIGLCGFNPPSEVAPEKN